MTKKLSANIKRYIPPYLKNKKKNKIYDEGGYFPTKNSALSYAGAVFGIEIHQIFQTMESLPIILNCDL